MGGTAAERETEDQRVGTPVKFNVLIPSRERADTLFHCLRTVVAQRYENVNIIVSDNFSQDNTREVVASFSDTRIRYVNTGRRVSMTANWEFALSHVTDGWVMFLGDDDGLYLGALALLDEAIRAHDVEAVAATAGSFSWPGHFDRYLGGGLVIPLTKGMEVRPTAPDIRRAFAGRLRYNKLPWLYNGGTASINLINRCRDAEGRFFRSSSPDIYSAVALSLATDEYLAIETPFALNGGSRHSTGTAFSEGRIEEPFLKFAAEDNIPFHETLVPGNSLQITLYEAYLQSWHIHRGRPGFSLADQLRVATMVAPSTQRERVEEQCRAIAAKNGVSFPVGKGRWLHRLRQFGTALGSPYKSLFLEPRTIGVENVYDAAVASTYLYRFVNHQVFPRVMFVVLAYMRRVVAKLKKRAMAR